MPDRPRRAANIPAERRIITVMAVDIVGSTRHIADCDPDDAQVFFDHCFARWRSAIVGAGGEMVSFEGDGGIAAFGWPDALEDHADRACAAAWAIQHGGNAGVGPGGRAVEFRVGLHSGLVAVRQVRRGRRSRLDTVGATVHIAAKLQQSAPPGGVVLSGEVARLCRGQLDVAPHDLPASIEGDFEAFRLGARPASPGQGESARRYRTPLIGRRAELARLLRKLPRAGRNRTVAVVGEPGIGKSRLAAAAVADAAAAGVSILNFYGDAQTRTTPFAAAHSLIREALRSPAGDGRDLDTGGVAEIERLLKSPDKVSHAKGIHLTHTQLARRLVQAFCDAAIDRPTLLLVEDLHLIDSESRLFLRLLDAAPTRHSFTLIVTGRPESLGHAHEIARTVLELEPLPRASMTALGELLWPAGRPPPARLAELVDRAEGIPFVLEELIHAVSSRSGGKALVLPQGVESVIHARLQRLSPTARAVAQALSLLGEQVDCALAAEVVGLGVDSILDDLRELERFAFVDPLQGSSVRMRHQILAEACADTIPRERRRQLHESAITAITALDPALDGRHEQLAFHAEGAGHLDEALEHLWEAALEARRNSASASLNLIFDRAIRLVDRIGDAAEERYVAFVLMSFASMLQLGEFEKMNLHLPRVMEVARRQGHPALVCNTLSQLGMICWFEGRHEEGLRASEEGLAIARQLQSPVLIYSNQLMLANNLHDLGQVARAIEETRELCEMLTGELEFARLGAPGLPRSMALSFMSWFMMDAGAYSEGLDYVERGLATALQAQDLYAEVLARNALGHNLLMLHRNQEAVDCLRVAREITESNGYDAVRANLLGRLAIALSRSGLPDEAIAIVEEALGDGVHLRTGRLEHYYLLAGYAEGLLCSGRREQGLAVLDEALAIARRIHNPCLIVDGLGLRTRMLARFDSADPRIARDRAERAALCETFGIIPWPDGAAGAPAMATAPMPEAAAGSA